MVIFMKNALLAQSFRGNMSYSLVASFATVVLTLTGGSEHKMKFK